MIPLAHAIWHYGGYVIAIAAILGLWALFGLVGEAAGFGAPRSPYDD
jgi:hypothetical protein